MIGDRIKSIRIRKGMSMQDIEDKSGIAKATISRIETGGTTKVRPSTLCKIADAFGVTVSDLTRPEAEYSEDLRVQVDEFKSIYKELGKEIVNLEMAIDRIYGSGQ